MRVIVAERKGANAVADPHYHVRWTGYSPDVDTWERRSRLVAGAPLVLAEWEVFKERILARTLEYQDMGPEYQARARPGADEKLPAKRRRSARETM